MKILELIPYLVEPGKLEDLLKQQGMSQDDDGLSIYMESELSLHSEIRIFSPEETDDLSEFCKDGINYVEFLPVGIAIDFLDTALTLKHKDVSGLDRVNELLHYGIYDA